MKKITPQFFEITNDKLHFTRSGKKINLKEIILLKVKSTGRFLSIIITLLNMIYLKIALE